MVAPDILPSPQVVGGSTHPSVICWHTEKPENLILCCNYLVYPSARSQSKEKD